ncbi:unnamed protein product [Amoebophrya sp. A25]|nr:unnamed protein product [Amoebophrya sp. A25]|eukprot:GSA25T00004042001.1
MAVLGYNRVSYEPPVPQVFGNDGGDIELPKFASEPSSSSSQLPSSRMKLKDRLALYEEDDPATQKWICCLGALCPPFLWTVGAIMYFWTPRTKTLTREAGYKNLLLAILSAAILFLLWALHYVLSGADAHISYDAVPMNGSPIKPMASPPASVEKAPAGPTAEEVP